MAVQERKNQEINQRPKLEERFIITLKGKDFVVYAGLLDLAHQKGLNGITVEAIQYPTKENGFEAICRATCESKTGDVFVELGDANPKNCNQMVVNHILRMAATRAKARALRDFTNIGMTCLEELGDLDDEVIGDEKPGNGRSKKTEAAKPESTNGKQTAAPATGNGKQNSPPSAGTNGGSKKTAQTASKEKTNGEDKRDAGPKPSTAQIRAIENLARRRNITAEELENMVQQQFGTTLPNLNSSEASNFIRTLQQSA
ncbi:MAG: hypothetical protein ABSH41_09490 [Syntrophobacteraceae bacterium]